MINLPKISVVETFDEFVARTFPELHANDKEAKTSLSFRTVTFQVTDACNLCCTYCYQINKGHRSMPFSVAKEFIDMLLEDRGGIATYLGHAPFIVLDFIGGEPFLEVDLLDQIVDYFRERAIELNHPYATNYCVSVCSNGVLYDDPKVQRFLVKNWEHLSFSVTVDGTKELHDSCRVFPDGKGSYDLAHHAAQDWMKRGYYMGSKITLAPQNIEFFAECLKQMIFDGYKEIHSNCVFENVWLSETEERYKYPKILYQQIKAFAEWFFGQGYDAKKYSIAMVDPNRISPYAEDNVDTWCGGTHAMLAVDPDGDIYPCLRFMESSLGTNVPAIKVGNVREGVAQSQCQKDCIECLRKITRRTSQEDECFYCPVGSGCSECSAFNYQTFGTADKHAKFICEMVKATALATNYYWNTYLTMFPDKREGNEVADLWIPEQWALPIIGKEEYEHLVKMTTALGGIVNRDRTEVRLPKDSDG